MIAAVALFTVACNKDNKAADSESNAAEVTVVEGEEINIEETTAVAPVVEENLDTNVVAEPTSLDEAKEQAAAGIDAAAEKAKEALQNAPKEAQDAAANAAEAAKAAIQ